MRDSIVFYRSFYEGLESLPDDSKGRVYSAIMKYAMDDEEPNLEGVEEGFFLMMKPQIDANNKRYLNGCKGGAPAGNKNAKKQPKVISKNNQNQPKVEKIKQPKQPNENVNVNDNVNVNVNVNENDKPIFVTLMLSDGTEYPVYEEDLDYWRKLYPAVNVEQQFRAMKGWCDSNPTKRKTRKGIARFINGWLSKEKPNNVVNIREPEEDFFAGISFAEGDT